MYKMAGCMNTGHEQKDIDYTIDSTDQVKNIQRHIKEYFF